jgi:hypothetical protein
LSLAEFIEIVERHIGSRIESAKVLQEEGGWARNVQSLIEYVVLVVNAQSSAIVGCVV